MRTQIVVLASLVTSSAYAERTGVGVVVTGEASVQPQLAAHVERWLHEKGRSVVSGPLEPEAINTLIDCFVLEDLGCARGVVDARSKANAVVFARAEMTANSDGTRDIAITGYWFQKDREAIAERRVCKSCNDERMHATVDDLMHGLVHDPPLPVAAATPDPLTAPPTESATPRWVPIGLVAIGATLVVSGGIMLAIDEDANPVGVQQPRIRDTATGGVVLGIAGALSLAGGVALWWRDHRSSPGPVAAVSGDGGYVGWAGRF